jgi:hypothetical protein
MSAALKAGTLYFAVVYATGFILGTARVLLLLPLVGEMAAVLFEAPLMLLVSWIAAHWSSRQFRVPIEPRPRLLMGGVALALLMIGELAVSTLIFNRSWEQVVSGYQSAPGALGLSAQVIFALLPLVQASLLRQRSGA